MNPIEKENFIAQFWHLLLRENYIEKKPVTVKVCWENFVRDVLKENKL